MTTRAGIALIAATSMLGAGCAGRAWPKQPVTVVAPAETPPPDALAPTRITTVDILPVDLELWAEDGWDGDLAEVEDAADASILTAAIDALGKRRYSIGAVMDENGDAPDGNALRHDDVIATLASLSRYGAATEAHRGHLPVPFLPARLGGTTGSDATLYVGGWGYVAKHHTGRGEKIAEGIAIGLLVLTVFAIIAIAAKSSGGGHSGGGGGGHGGGGGGHGGSHSVGHHAGGIDPHGAQTPDGSVGGGTGVAVYQHGGLHESFGHRVGGGGGGGHHGGSAIGHVARDGLRTAADVAEDVVDAFGHAPLEIDLDAPEWTDDPTLPHTGGSQMYLEMTLVDNKTGLAIWHSHQRFPARASSAAEAARAAKTVAATLPVQTM